MTSSLISELKEGVFKAPFQNLKTELVLFLFSFQSIDYLSSNLFLKNTLYNYAGLGVLKKKIIKSYQLGE